MILNVRYVLLFIITIPVSPFLYIQSKWVRRKVPDLGEADDPAGVIELSSQHRLKCLCLGESTMAGVGVRRHLDGLAGNIAKTLSSNLNTSVSFEVFAKSGYTVREVFRKLLPAMEMHRPDIIILAIGANDAFAMTPPWRLYRQTRDLVAALKNKYPSSFIVFANMPPIRDFPALTPMLRWFLGHYIKLIGDAIDEACHNTESVLYYPRQVTIEDWVHRLKVIDDPSAFFSDGIHPSRLTYEIWGKDIIDFVTGSSAFQDYFTSVNT